MAKTVDKAEYRALFMKGEEHEASGDFAIEQKHYNSAITNYSTAIINYLDSLNVNRFGKDLSSDSHEAAPHILLKSLNQIGIVDFKATAGLCGEALRLKNVASYRSEELTAKHAKVAQKAAREAKAYVEKTFDASVVVQTRKR